MQACYYDLEILTPLGLIKKMPQPHLWNCGAKIINNKEMNRKNEVREVQSEQISTSVNKTKWLCLFEFLSYFIKFLLVYFSISGRFDIIEKSIY